MAVKRFGARSDSLHSMARVLVLHATWHDQTARIAQRMAQVLTQQGHGVVVRSALEPDTADDMAAFDAVIVGAAIHRGNHHPRLAHMVRKFITTLRSRRNAFFSVSLSAAGTPRQRDIALGMMDKFLDATGWHPDETAIFAGALQYSRYHFALRLMMRFIAGLSGRDTDTSRDYDYTDWAAVERFATNFGSRLAPAVAA